VAAGAARFHFDAVSGELVRITRNGRDLLAAPPQLCLWRAPTDNDGIKQGPLSEVLGVRRRWLAWGLDRLRRESCRGEVSERGDGSVVALSESSWCGAGALRIVQRRRILVGGDGVLHCEEDVSIPASCDDLPRVGVSFALVAGFERCRWYGRGPHESYPDRRVGAALGIWESTVDAQYVRYSVPQEHGSHGDSRWASFSSPRLGTVVIGAARPFSFSASHYSAVDLTAALHPGQLRRRDEVYVHVDAAMRGIGTAACGPDTLPRYRVGGGRHRWTWTLRLAD
jgi:beta-galactosidase